MNLQLRTVLVRQREGVFFIVVIFPGATVQADWARRWGTDPRRPRPAAFAMLTLPATPSREGEVDLIRDPVPGGLSLPPPPLLVSPTLVMLLMLFSRRLNPLGHEGKTGAGVPWVYCRGCNIEIPLATFGSPLKGAEDFIPEGLPRGRLPIERGTQSRAASLSEPRGTAFLFTGVTLVTLRKF